VRIDVSALQGALSSFLAFLHNQEPTFIRQLALPLRLAALYSITRIAWVAFLLALAIVFTMVVRPTLSILRSSARWGNDERLTALARIYVRIEAFAMALGMPPTAIPQDEMPEEPHQYSPRRWEWITVRPQAIGGLRYLLWYFIHSPFVVAFRSLSLIRVTIRYLAPRRMINIVAWLAVLTYVGLLPQGLQLLQEIHFGDFIQKITLAHILAAGSIVVLLYVAIGSDIRGRAELNKNASFECRKTLHACQSMLEQAANILAFMRRCFIEELRYYPSVSGLQELTGRTDLVWHGSGIAPKRIPRAVLRRWWWNTAFLDPAAQHPMLFPASHTRPLAHDTSYAARTLAIRASLNDLDTMATSFEKALTKLDNSGFSFKLRDVLSKRHLRILVYLERYHLGSITARNSLLPKDALCFPEDESSEILSTDIWSELNDTADSDVTLIGAYDSLSQLIHQTARKARFKHWQMAVAEQYLRSLSWAIQKTLRPTVAERLRQAIGK
jgi:hypothetical protein